MALYFFEKRGCYRIPRMPPKTDPEPNQCSSIVSGVEKKLSVLLVFLQKEKAQRQ